MPQDSEIQKAWVATVDMGLGHQRATYPLQHLAEGDIITVGGSVAADPSEKKLWDRMRNMYEFLSRVRKTPIVGKPLFGMLDALQSIPPFYPIRDMSAPAYQVKLLSRFIDKGLCKGMIQTINITVRTPRVPSPLRPIRMSGKPVR